jgi:hypothetical protein
MNKIYLFEVHLVAPLEHGTIDVFQLYTGQNKKDVEHKLTAIKETGTKIVSIERIALLQIL